MGESKWIWILLSAVIVATTIVTMVPGLNTTVTQWSISDALTFLQGHGYNVYADINGDWNVTGDASISGNLTATGLEAPTGRGATYVVASSDAPAHVKAQADYLCDGTDDNVIINQAFDALTLGRTAKETVKLVGTFSISANMSIPSYTIVDLTSANLSLTNNANDVVFINDNYATTDRDIEIIGGYIDGNNANQDETTILAKFPSTITAEGLGLITLVGVEHFNIENIEIANPELSGLELIDCIDGSVSGNYIYEASDDNIAINTGCAYITIDNNVTKNAGHNKTKSDLSGCTEIEIQGAHDITVIGNHCIKEYNTPVGQKIRTCFLAGEHATSDDGYNIIFEGNTVDMVGGPAWADRTEAFKIYAPVGETIENVLINNNVVNIDATSNYSSASFIVARARGAGIANNLVILPNLGIEFTDADSDNVTVSGNTFLNYGSASNTIAVRVNDVALNQARFNNNIMSDLGYAGYYFSDGSSLSDVVINDDSILGPTATDWGIYFQTAPVISDVYIYDNHIQTVGAVWNNQAGVVWRHNTGFITEHSGTSTGTGAEQTIAHGLNITPGWDDIGVWSDNGTSAHVYMSTAPDATNIYVTCNATGSRWHWSTLNN